MIEVKKTIQKLDEKPKKNNILYSIKSGFKKCMSYLKLK
jgi:hypothetical protein